MALKTKNLVEIPPHTVFQKKGNARYVYLITKSFRNEKGQPDNKRVAIGRVDEESGLLIPNMNYYELFQAELPATIASNATTVQPVLDEPAPTVVEPATPIHPVLPVEPVASPVAPVISAPAPIATTKRAPVAVAIPNTVRNCGTYALCRRFIEELRLDDLLQQTFGEDSDRILAAAHYVLTSSNTMYYLEDWQSSTLSFTEDTLDTLTLGKLFQNLAEDQQDSFFDDWTEEQGEEQFITYNATSVSSFSRGMDIADNGVLKDKVRLSQINYGLVVGEAGNMPLSYRFYPLALTDRNSGGYMLGNLRPNDDTKTVFVMDKAFFKGEHIKAIEDRGLKYVILIPNTMNIYKKLVDENKADILDKIGDHNMFCKKTKSLDYGFRVNVHIFYNRDKASEEMEILNQKLDAMEYEIENLPGLPGEKSPYYEFFDISMEKDGTVIPTRKTARIKRALDRCGFFIIAENMYDKRSDEVLSILKEKDNIEKYFDNLGNSIDMEKLRCSKEEAISGKMFVSFIAYILYTKFQNALSSYCKENRVTLEKVFHELDCIKIAYDRKYPTTAELLTPLTLAQTEILEHLGVNGSIFENLF